MLTTLHTALCLFLSSYPKVDSVLQMQVGVEVQENQNSCRVDGMFIADRLRCFYYLAHCHSPSVGHTAVACSLLNLFKSCKLLTVVNLCKEEGM